MHGELTAVVEERSLEMTQAWGSGAPTQDDVLHIDLTKRLPYSMVPAGKSPGGMSDMSYVRVSPAAAVVDVHNTTRGSSPDASVYIRSPSPQEPNREQLRSHLDAHLIAPLVSSSHRRGQRASFEKLHQSLFHNSSKPSPKLTQKIKTVYKDVTSPPKREGTPAVMPSSSPPPPTAGVRVYSTAQQRPQPDDQVSTTASSTATARSSKPLLDAAFALPLGERSIDLTVWGRTRETKKQSAVQLFHSTPPGVFIPHTDLYAIRHQASFKTDSPRLRSSSSSPMPSPAHLNSRASPQSPNGNLNTSFSPTQRASPSQQNRANHMFEENMRGVFFNKTTQSDMRVVKCEVDPRMLAMAEQVEEVASLRYPSSRRRSLPESTLLFAEPAFTPSLATQSCVHGHTLENCDDWKSPGQIKRAHSLSSDATSSSLVARKSVSLGHIPLSSVVEGSLQMSTTSGAVRSPESSPDPSIYLRSLSASPTQADAGSSTALYVGSSDSLHVGDVGIGNALDGGVGPVGRGSFTARQETAQVGRSLRPQSAREAPSHQYFSAGTVESKDLFESQALSMDGLSAQDETTNESSQGAQGTRQFGDQLLKQPADEREEEDDVYEGAFEGIVKEGRGSLLQAASGVQDMSLTGNSFVTRDDLVTRDETEHPLKVPISIDYEQIQILRMYFMGQAMRADGSCLLKVDGIKDKLGYEARSGLSVVLREAGVLPGEIFLFPSPSNPQEMTAHILIKTAAARAKALEKCCKIGLRVQTCGVDDLLHAHRAGGRRDNILLGADVIHTPGWHGSSDTHDVSSDVPPHSWRPCRPVSAKLSTAPPKSILRPSSARPATSSSAPEPPKVPPLSLSCITTPKLRPLSACFAIKESESARAKHHVSENEVSGHDQVVPPQAERPVSARRVFFQKEQVPKMRPQSARTSGTPKREGIEAALPKKRPVSARDGTAARPKEVSRVKRPLSARNEMSCHPDAFRPLSARKEANQLHEQVDQSKQSVNGSAPSHPSAPTASPRGSSSVLKARMSLLSASFREMEARFADNEMTYIPLSSARTPSAQSTNNNPSMPVNLMLDLKVQPPVIPKNFPTYANPRFCMNVPARSVEAAQVSGALNSSNALPPRPPAQHSSSKPPASHTSRRPASARTLIEPKEDATQQASEQTPRPWSARDAPTTSNQTSPMQSMDDAKATHPFLVRHASAPLPGPATVKDNLSVPVRALVPRAPPVKALGLSVAPSTNQKAQQPSDQARITPRTSATNLTAVSPKSFGFESVGMSPKRTNTGIRPRPMSVRGGRTCANEQTYQNLLHHKGRQVPQEFGWVYWDYVLENFK